MSRIKRLVVTVVSTLVIVIASQAQNTSAQSWDCHACSNYCDEIMAQMACDAYCPDGYVATYCQADQWEFCDSSTYVITCSSPEPN